MEGDVGEEFFLIESGTAIAVKRDINGHETVVKQLGKGDYFGGKRSPGGLSSANAPQSLL